MNEPSEWVERWRLAQSTSPILRRQADADGWLDLRPGPLRPGCNARPIWVFGDQATPVRAILSIPGST